MKVRSTSPLAVFTLLALAFGAGILFARLWLFPPTPSSSLSPLLPSPVPSSPTAPPTATATTVEAGDVLETLFIDIAPADFARIEAKREEALQLGILLTTGGDYVPATIRLGHDEIPVELRLKGDWIDHFAHDKWSFRVRTLGDHYLFGMRTFSLQDPGTRGFLNEWLFLENLRREGVLTVRYHFVHVVQNGKYKGIYALEEAFSKELFEAQERREGLIIRYDEDLLWEYRALYDDQTMAPGVERFYIIDDFQSARISADPVLSVQRDAAFGLLRAMWSGQRTAADVFDLEKMGAFLALSDLWNAEHALIWHNQRYYYNPITAHLEPVVFDAHPLPDYLDPDMVGLQQDFFYDVFYRDPQMQAAYVRTLSRLIQPGYVEELEAEFGAEFGALRTTLEPEFGSDRLEPPWGQLRRRQELLRQMLHPYRTVYAFVQRPQPNLTTTIQVDVGNLLALPLEVVGVEAEGTLVDAKPRWVDPESAPLVVPPDAGASTAVVLRPLEPEATFLPYAHLRIPREELPITATADMPELTIVTRLWGLTTTHTQTVVPGYPLPQAEGPLPEIPSVEQALAQHPYLERLPGEDVFRILTGTWEINDNLVLPAGFGLRLEPGTTLRFGNDNYLLASGPLDFQGTADAPILLQPITDRWSGIIVLQASAPSAWDHVTVERTSAVDQDGWTLTGGITFYESPVRLDHCRIVDAQAEDAINVVRTTFAFRQSEFVRAASDAFDADFAQGTIQECVFHDIGGDGFDLSGSEVQVRGLRLLNVGDKGISVGEASRLAAQDVHFENVRFGLVSKDLSEATIENATIINAQQAALAAYIKKANYGPATVTADDITFVDTLPERYTLVQTGSWIELEGTRVWGTDVDVEALYPPTD